MLRTFTRLTSFRFSLVPSTLARYLQPVALNKQQTQTMPILKLKSQKYMMQNWWSQRPFQVASTMTVPVFSFENAQFANRTIDLPEDIFNHPLRRDLMHRLYDFRINLNKFTTKVTRNRAMTAGSGIKMRAQKKTGRARLGDKRAPHLRKGGKAHGSKAKVYSYHLNIKIKLKALKALLSAKMAEGRIKIVTSQTLNEPKTKFLSSLLKRFCQDSRTLYCIITGENVDKNFALAHQNIKKIIHHTPYSLDVMSLFKADKILITEEGLTELIENIYKTEYVAFRQPHMPKYEEKKPEEQQEKIDPSQPYEFKFKILAEYMEKFEKLKQENPQYLTKEKQRIRKIELDL